MGNVGGVYVIQAQEGHRRVRRLVVQYFPVVLGHRDTFDATVRVPVDPQVLFCASYVRVIQGPICAARHRSGSSETADKQFKDYSKEEYFLICLTNVTSIGMRFPLSPSFSG